MSTRGAIARATENGFVGRYHHSDSYPEGLGKTLYDLCRGHFKGDHQRMLEVLIDEHPAGWSCIVETDFSLEPGIDGHRRPKCYCHGPCPDDESVIDQDNVYGLEFVYVIDENGQMTVLRVGFGNPTILAEVDLNSDDEPDWESMEGN